MYPSILLRNKLEKELNINLTQYHWNKSLENQILNIKLNPNLEELVSNFKEVYENGYNIGHCGLTSRYISINIPETTMYIGTCRILKGTFASPNGEHAWIIYHNLIIDPTLMTSFPIELQDELGYNGKAIAKSSSKILSEYDLYSHEYSNKQKEPHFLEKRLTKTLIKNKNTL